MKGKNIPQTSSRLCSLQNSAHSLPMMTLQHLSAQAFDQPLNETPHMDNSHATARNAHYVGRTNTATTDRPQPLTTLQTSKAGIRKAPRANCTAYPAQSPSGDREETLPSLPQILYHPKCQQQYGTSVTSYERWLMYTVIHHKRPNQRGPVPSPLSMPQAWAEQRR